jgi:hypothetical protein
MLNIDDLFLQCSLLQTDIDMEKAEGGDQDLIDVLQEALDVKLKELRLQRTFGE